LRVSRARRDSQWRWSPPESYSPEQWYRKSRVDITPQHLFAWRKAAWADRLTLPAEQPPMFVPVVPAIREVSAAVASANGPASIVVEIAGAVARAERGVDLGWLRDVLRAVRAAT
jgi:transposase